MISEVKDKIKKWLTDEELYDNEVVDKNAQFNFVAKHQNIILHVFQPLSKKDSILVVCSLNLNEEQKKRLTNVEKMELYQKLLSTDSLFEFHPNINELENIRIQDFIFYDGLSKNEFMKTIFKLLKTVQIVNSYVQPSR